VDTLVSDTVPKILKNLAAAGLVTHELIGDPARLAGESAALAALCARVGGAVYRLAAFHYAFRIDEHDVGGALARSEPGSWGKALEAALVEELGAEAVWVTAADLVADVEADLDSRHVMFLKAAGGAIGTALAEIPDLQAVVHAGIAASSAEAAARATAGAIAQASREAGAGAEALLAALATLGDRVEALEAGIDARVAAAVVASLPGVLLGDTTLSLAETVSEAASRRLGDEMRSAFEAAVSQAASAANRSPEPGFERLIDTMELLVGRMTEQAARASEQAARQDALASGIAAVEASLEAFRRAADDRSIAREATRAGALEAFEQRLGMALAEFLAQIAERSAPPAPGGRVVEIGRTVPLPPAATETVAAGAPAYAGPLARAVQVG
jgi:hypothetical protein